MPNDDTLYSNTAPPHASHFWDVEGIRITGHGGANSGRCAYLYLDESAAVPTLVIQCDRVRVVAGEVVVEAAGAARIRAADVAVAATDTADLRGRVTVLHAGEVLKTDCAGVGTRLDAGEIAGTVVRRDWDGDGVGSGYQRHAPEIPLAGPPLHTGVGGGPGGDGPDGGPPWDQWADHI